MWFLQRAPTTLQVQQRLSKLETEMRGTVYLLVTILHPDECVLLPNVTNDDTAWSLLVILGF